jgi:hypothetical protein
VPVVTAFSVALVTVKLLGATHVALSVENWAVLEVFAAFVQVTVSLAPLQAFGAVRAGFPGTALTVKDVEAPQALIQPEIVSVVCTRQ